MRHFKRSGSKILAEINFPGTYHKSFIRTSRLGVLTVSAFSLAAALMGQAAFATTYTYTGATDGNWDTSTANFTTGSGNVAYANGNDVIFDDSATGSGNITVGGASGVAITPTSVTIGSSGGTKNYTLTTNNTTGIGGAGSLTLAAGYKGTATLSGANTYSGGTFVNTAYPGVLVFSNDNSLGQAGTAITFGNLYASGRMAIMAANFSTNRPIVLTSGTGDYISIVSSGTVASPTTPLSNVSTFSGNMSGGGALWFVNVAGTIKLTGNNSYSGGTYLQNNTTLQITSTPGTSATGSGNVLFHGTGSSITSTAGTTTSITGRIGLDAQGNTSSKYNVVSPGGAGAVGQLNVGGLDLSGNSTLNFDINGATHDLLQDSGTLTLNASGNTNGSKPTIALTTTGTLAGSYVLASYQGTGISNSSFVLPTAPAGYTWHATNNQLGLTNHTPASASFSTSTPAGSAMVGTANPGNTTPSSVITLTGAGAGNYSPAYLNNITANGNKGYVQINGFSNGDSQIVALSLTVNGSAPTAAQLTEILADLNFGSNAIAFATNSAGGSFTTSLQTTNPAAYNALIAGDSNYATHPFEIALLNPTGLTPGSPTYLSLDFSNETDATTGLQNVLVTDIAAIPEPITTVLVAATASLGLLRRRRKSAANS